MNCVDHWHCDPAAAAHLCTKPDRAAPCPTCGADPLLTADTITDEQIEKLFESLPPGHYARQWCLDARFPSSSHPHRQRNARQQCAEILNERARQR